MSAASRGSHSAVADAAISPADYAFLAHLIEERSAMLVDPGKEYLLRTRLGPVMREARLADLGALVEALRAPRSAALVERVVDAMTINETSFFRDSHPFDVVADTIVPGLLATRRDRTITIWCGAASSGQEPYSIAMLLRERFPSLVDKGRVRIIATDLSPTMVDRIDAGVYTSFEVGRGLSPELLARHFEGIDGGWRVRRPLRAMVEARTLNLTGSWDGLPRCDLVLLRNVLIYFSQDTKRRILERIRTEVLVPDGALLLGSSESTLNVDPGYERCDVGKQGYYRPASSA